MDACNVATLANDAEQELASLQRERASEPGCCGAGSTVSWPSDGRQMRLICTGFAPASYAIH